MNDNDDNNLETHLLDENMTDELKKIVEEDRIQIPYKKLAELFTLLLVLIVLTSFKGSSKFPSLIGIAYCKAGYWILNLSMFVICAICIKILIDRFSVRDALKDRLGYKFHPSEYRISPSSAINISGASLIAGTLAGLLGIGGGMVINPLLLELGMKPTVVASTTGFTILFTSSLSLA